MRHPAQHQRFTKGSCAHRFIASPIGRVSILIESQISAGPRETSSSGFSYCIDAHLAFVPGADETNGIGTEMMLKLRIALPPTSHDVNTSFSELTFSLGNTQQGGTRQRETFHIGH